MGDCLPVSALCGGFSAQGRLGYPERRRGLERFLKHVRYGARSIVLIGIVSIVRMPLHDESTRVD